MKTHQEEPPKVNSSNKNNVIFFSSNQQISKNGNKSFNHITPQTTILNKSNQFPSKDIRLNKLNINSSMNNPSQNTATNISLNEQILHPKRDHSDYFDNEIIFQGGEENDPLFKEYTMINEKKNKAIDDFKNINERIKNNNIKIEEIKKSLIDLKEEKKQKQADIINLLSNKESIEEIYKNQIYALSNNPNRQRVFNINNSNNNIANINKKNDVKSLSVPNSGRNNSNLLNQMNNDEDTFKITLNEIKESDQKKYSDQVNNMFEDIFKKKDKKLNSLINKIIKGSYQQFATVISKENNNESNNETIITNFFKKLSLFISNHSLGRFSESKINLFLRYLLKINAINVKLTQYIKFVNKKYKERKKELNDMLNFLEKKNLNLNEKNNRLENNMKDFDDKLDFFEKNDAFDFEQDNSDEGIYDIDKKKLKKNKLLKRNKKKDNENDEQLSHDVVIEYEDGIDQNVEINYEDDLANDYDYEREKEMINQGLNPYKNDGNQNTNRLNSKSSAVTNKQNNKNINQIIVKDNDESDKILNELLQNKDDKNKINQPPINTLTSVMVDNRTNLQPTKTLDDKELEQLTDIERQHYQRVQRIMNSGPKVNNIFGVNNYNPENSINTGVDNSLFSPKKNIGNIPTSSNKIDKTIRIGSRQNHNFVSVINKTKYVPVKKKDRTNRTKEKSKKNKTEENDGIIQVINLEENFLNEINNDENDNKTSNEIISNQTNNNSKINKNNFNDIVEHEVIKSSINDSKNNKNINNNIIINNINNNINNINNNNINNIINNSINNNNNIIISSSNINNLNIMNSKQQNKENVKIIKKEDNIPKLINNGSKNNLKNENSENNEFFSNMNKKTLKITKSRELNINDLKNNKIGIINKKIGSKGHNTKKTGKAKTKLILMKNAENKEGFPLNNSLSRGKGNNSLSKNLAVKKISNNNIVVNTTGNISYKDYPGKRSHSIAENIVIKQEEGINKQFNNNVTKVVVSTNNSINTSQNSVKNRKIGIPISKVKNPNYNSNTFENSLKKDVTILKK